MFKKTIIAAGAMAMTFAGAAHAQAARDYISIAGSSTVFPFSAAVAEQFGRGSKFKTPKVEGECDKCHGHEFKRRPDDNEETVRTRMAEYRAKTAPILPIYESRGIVSRVDGMADMDVVTDAVAAILDGPAA